MGVSAGGFGHDEAVASPLVAGDVPDATESAEIVARSPSELFWRRIRRDRVALTSIAFIGLLVIVAITAPLIVMLVGAHPPNQQNADALNQFGEPLAPGGSYIFGTDELGRDVFSRTLYGARISLTVALASTTLIVIFGVLLGMLAGYYRGWVDTGLARAFDVLLAFPVLLLALGLAAACTVGGGCIPVSFFHLGIEMLVVSGAFGLASNAYWLVRDSRSELAPRHRGRRLILRNLPCVLLLALGLALLLAGGHGTLIRPGLNVVIFIITLSTVPYLARIIRGQVLSIREKEYIDALRALGASDSRILFRHVLPNLTAPIIVYATLLIPQTILFEAALSFLGVGIQPPTADWGTMIAQATSVFSVAWWYMTVPGAALLLTVLAFNFLGDAVQDALRPRHGPGEK